ncbi:hypothetical protein ABZP36_006351 [Zizania latifolia]
MAAALGDADHAEWFALGPRMPWHEDHALPLAAKRRQPQCRHLSPAARPHCASREAHGPHAAAGRPSMPWWPRARETEECCFKNIARRLETVHRLTNLASLVIFTRKKRYLFYMHAYIYTSQARCIL